MAERLSESPPFWWEDIDWRARALWPAERIYGAVALRRMERAPREKVAAPVLCVGNFTVGGAGKTPVALSLAARAIESGLKPGFLSRGHGGSFARPKLVDGAHDLARHVGDEPLLLAAVAPVAVSPDRKAGADLLLAEGCDFLIMDDGFQSARIHIDYALLVVDAQRGIGNGRVIPAGPLRAPLIPQLRYADALLNVGSGNASDRLVRQAARAARPIFEADTRPLNPAMLEGRRFFAFAGIGNNRKFFDTVEAHGGELAGTRSFADHHLYADDELEDLAQSARRLDARLITTEKDSVRLRHGSEVARSLAQHLDVLKIATVFDDPGLPVRLITATRDAYARRRRGE